MAANQVSIEAVSRRGRTLRAACAALAFVAAISIDHRDGHVRATDAATPPLPHPQVAVTIEKFDPSTLPATAFAD